MIRTCSAIVVALLTAGCAYKNPDAPSAGVPPISTTVPYTLTLGATTGVGANAGRAVMSAKVQNVNGEVMPGVIVEFTTDTGILSASSVVTGADGVATTTITFTSSQAASITATAGTLTVRTLVASQPIVMIPAPAANRS